MTASNATKHLFLLYVRPIGCALIPNLECKGQQICVQKQMPYLCDRCDKKMCIWGRRISSNSSSNKFELMDPNTEVAKSNILIRVWTNVQTNYSVVRISTQYTEKE